MVAAPSVNFTVLDNGLGQVPVSPANVIAVFGCSSAGAANAPSDLYDGSPGEVVTDFGYGPGPELVANLVRSGIRTIFTKVATDVAGAVSAVTHTGTGTCVVSISGTPFDQYSIKIFPTTAGTPGSDPAPGFKITFDDEETLSREILVPSTLSYTGLAATTGLTFNFTAGTLVVGDEYAATTTPPLPDAAGTAAAVDGFLTGTAQEAGILYGVGPVDSTDAAVIAESIGAFIGRKKFVRMILEARDQNSGETEAEWIASLSNDFSGFTNDRICVSAGAVLCASTLSGFRFRRIMGFPAAVRAGLVTARTKGPTFSQDLGAVEDGGLAAFSQNGQANLIATAFHDEALNPGLNSARFMTATSIPGKTGLYFVTNSNLMSGPASDFSILPLGRLMDEACRVTNLFFTDKLGTSVRLNPRTGRILDKDARALESGCNVEILKAIIATGNASQMLDDAYCTVSRVDNIALTQTLTVTVSLLPLGYLRTINVTMTFVNPATAVAA